MFVRLSSRSVISVMCWAFSSDDLIYDGLEEDESVIVNNWFDDT